MLLDTLGSVLADADYFGPDGPVPCAAELAHPRFAVVTGENASGKSFLVRTLAHRMREDRPRLEVMAVTMNMRSRGGMERAFIWGDEGRDSTGRLSVKAVIGGLKTCRERDHDHVLILDEPDIGLAEGYAGALGEYVAAFVDEMPERTLGLIVVTHSRPLVRSLMPTDPTSIRVGDDPRPLARWLEEGPIPRTLADIEGLAERSSATMSGINRVRLAREAVEQPSGPRP
jgi:hypothetical protein